MTGEVGEMVLDALALADVLDGALDEQQLAFRSALGPAGQANPDELAVALTPAIFCPDQDALFSEPAKPVLGFLPITEDVEKRSAL